MSIQAAQRMGLSCVSLDPASDSSASQIADSIIGDLSDPNAIAQLMSTCDAVTLENEFIPATAILLAVKQTGFSQDRLVPSIQTLALIQDKLTQREALMRAGVPSPRACAIGENVRSVVEKIGFPMVLKIRFGGYDGKGTLYAKTEADLDAMLPIVSQGGWLAEEFVPFRRELAVMVYRYGPYQGTFPTVETIQTNHVCDLVFPAGLDASEIAMNAVEAMDGQGLYGVELFELDSGELQVNEIAPRPHNTGHYSLDWGGPSQFEAHIRAVTGMAPAQISSPQSGFVMANLLGVPKARDFRLGIKAALETPGCFVHWYGKSQSRPGRKMGHLNVVAAQWDRSLIQSATDARDQFYQAWSHSDTTNET